MRINCNRQINKNYKNVIWIIQCITLYIRKKNSQTARQISYVLEAIFLLSLSSRDCWVTGRSMFLIGQSSHITELKSRSLPSCPCRVYVEGNYVEPNDLTYNLTTECACHNSLFQYTSNINIVICGLKCSYQIKHEDFGFKFHGLLYHLSFVFTRNNGLWNCNYELTGMTQSHLAKIMGM